MGTDFEAGSAHPSPESQPHIANRPTQISTDRVQRIDAPLRRQLTDLIATAISTGNLAPGTRIYERELSHKYGVSRTVVREALRQLEADEMVNVVPHKGVYVCRLTRETVESIYDVRALLESYLVGRFLTESTKSDLDRLEQCLAEIEATAERSVHGRLSETDIHHLVDLKDSFYQTLFDGGRNRIAAEALEKLKTRVRALRTVTMRKEGRVDASVAELREIVALIRAGDPAAAALAARHVEEAKRIALATLGQESAAFA